MVGVVPIPHYEIDTANMSDAIGIKASVDYFLSIFYLSPNDSPSKNMKNVFYFV